MFFYGPLFNSPDLSDFISWSPCFTGGICHLAANIWELSLMGVFLFCVFFCCLNQMDSNLLVFAWRWPSHSLSVFPIDILKEL